MTDLSTLEGQATDLSHLVQDAEKTAIKEFAAHIVNKAAEDDLSHTVVFNALQHTLTGFLLTYGMDGNSLNLKIVSEAFNAFCKGLEHQLNGMIDGLRKDAEQIKEVATEAVS